MLTRPRFKPAFTVHRLPPHQVVLIDERRSYVLDSRACYHLAPLLNGSRTSEELIDSLDPDVSAVEVLHAINTLESRGYLDEASDVPEARGAFWQQLGVPEIAAESLVASARVRVAALTDAESAAADVRAALAAQGFTASADADIVVVLTDDYLRPELSAINAELLGTRTPWLVAKPVGSVLWLGPIFTPDQGPCWECMAERIRGNRHTETYLSRHSGGRRPPVSPAPAALPTTISTAAHLIALELTKWRSGAAPTLAAQLRTINLVSLESKPHAVVRRPQCAACGDPDWRLRAPSPIELQPRPRVRDEGGFRTVSPEATFARLAHHISPITGVVSSLEPLLGGAGDLAWSYAAGHNFAMMTDSLFFLRQNLRGRSGGKGTTEIQAKVGGLCEAIERYSGVWRREEPVRRASYRELNGEAIHPVPLMNYSAAQYRGRHAWNAAQPHTRFHVVPEPFDEDKPIDWTPAWSLTNRRFGWAPAAYCYFGHPDLRESFFCVADANGTAAGNSLEEAILQGSLEAIERDAVALWWYNRLRKPAVDLDSFDMPGFRALVDYHARMNRELTVIDITSDLGVPVFVGMSRRLDRPVEDIIIGFGAHLDPRLAIMRAITEVNQFLPAILQTNPDGSTRYWFDDTDAINWWKTATVATQPYVAPDPAMPRRCASDYPQLWGDDFRQDVEQVVAIAARAGLEVFVNEQTRPDVQFPVAKVIVPGLRHFWRRLGPGRLYDVPVTLGWQAAPTREEDMNPISIFF